MMAGTNSNKRVDPLTLPSQLGWPWSTWPVVDDGEMARPKRQSRDNSSAR